MAFRNSNTKRKYTKRHPNAKRKYTKRCTNTKRKYTNRISKKYGGKCSNMTDKTKMDNLIKYLNREGGYSLRDANDIVDGMVKNKYIYNCDNILKTLKNDGLEAYHVYDSKLSKFIGKCLEAYNKNHPRTTNVDGNLGKAIIEIEDDGSNRDFLHSLQKK